MTFKSWSGPCSFMLSSERCLLMSTINVRSHDHWLSPSSGTGNVLSCHCDSSSGRRNSK